MENNEGLIEPKVVRAGVKLWHKRAAGRAHFTELLRYKTGLYSVAVGYNEDGTIVNAFILEKYRRSNIAHRRVLLEKAKKIFGLEDTPNPPSA